MRKINCIATDMIPIRLIISIAVISAIVAMVSFGYNNLNIISSENQIEIECHELESKLSVVVSTGVARDLNEIGSGSGTIRTQTFELPDNLVYLSFGVDPDPNNTGEIKTGLTEKGAVIFYKVSGGSKHVLWMDGEKLRFREGKFRDDVWIINDGGQGYILRCGGKTTLIFELVQHYGDQYILIHNNDSIDKA